MFEIIADHSQAILIALVSCYALVIVVLIAAMIYGVVKLLSPAERRRKCAAEHLEKALRLRKRRIEKSSGRLNA
jgi:hypothetical protein